MYKIASLLIVLSVMMIKNVKSQDLMNMFDEETPVKEYTAATFKTTHLIIGQSVENVAKDHLNLVISHHFGKVNEGLYNFFGLDQSTIRLGLEYGVTNRLEVGIGRSTYQKTVDGYVKYKLLRQNNLNMPLAVSYYGSTAVNTLRWADPARVNFFTSRLSFVHQLLIARKFNEKLSLQLMPSFVHKNIVPTIADQNDVYAMGAGGRYKLTRRMSINAEYYYLLPGKTADETQNSLSLGFDLETGGHVFQLFFTNSQPLFERGFITETQGQWNKADVYFGFNIIRTFRVVKAKEKGK